MNALLRCLCTVFCIGLVVPAHSQTIVATLELDRREPRPELFEYVAEDEGLVTIAASDRKSERELSLYKYDATLKRQWTQPLVKTSSNVEVEQLHVLGNRILVFVRELVPRGKTLELRMLQFDLQGRRLSEPMTLFISQNERQMHPMMRYERSLDRTRLLLIGKLDRLRDAKADEAPATYHYALLAHQRDTVQRGLIKLPYTAAQFDLEHARIHAGTNIYLVGRFMPNPNNDYYEHRLIRFRHGGALREYPLTLPGRIVVDVTAKADLNDDLVVSGFYSNRAADQIAGTLVARFSAKADSMTLLAAQPMAPAFLARLMTARAARRGQELTDFYLDDMVLRSDGGLLLFAEKYFLTSNSYRDAFGYFYSRQQHTYEDIIALSIAPDGSTEWATQIPKSQVGEQREQLSYALLVGAEQMYVFYKAYTKPDGDNVFYHTLDAEGALGTPQPFLKNFRSGDIFYRTNATQISNNQAILVYYQSAPRTFTMAKVEF